MKLEFRNGVVSHSKTILGDQNFLSVVGAGVQISAVNTPLIVTIAHTFNRDYLHFETRDIVAWPNAPFLTGVRYYLFIDLDKNTAVRTFGFSTLKPVVQFGPPPTTEPIVPIVFDSPLLQTGRHWYDTINFRHYVFEGGSWREIIRVFVGSLFNNAFTSESINAPLFTGTQIGITTSNHSGRILFDESGNALRRPDGTFLTTESSFFTNFSRVDAIRLESNIATIQNDDAAAVAAFQIVAIQPDGKFKTAIYEDTGSTVLAILTQDTLFNDYGGVIIQGTITNPAWNWPTSGVPLWVDNGALVDVDPHIANNLLHPIGTVPTARVLTRDTVIFEQGLGGKGDQGESGAGAVPPMTTTMLGTGVISVPPVNPLLPIVVGNNDPRNSDARVPLFHTHPGTDITIIPGSGISSPNAQGAIIELAMEKVDRAGDTMTGNLILTTVLPADPPLRAVTKQYVDALETQNQSDFVNVSGDTMTGFLFLNADPTLPLHAATKAYVDSLVAGLIWLDPILFPDLTSDTVAAPPSVPTVGETYIVPPGGLGAWLGLDGSVVEWDGSSWINRGLISTFPINSRFGISFEGVPAPSGTFAGQANRIAVLTNPIGPVWSFAPVPVVRNAVFVNNDASVNAFHQFTYTGTHWVEFSGTQPILAGNFLVHTGNFFHVVGLQPADSTLTGLAAMGLPNGIVVQTALDTFTKRSIVTSTSGVIITNGDGVAGNPSIDLSLVGNSIPYDIGFFTKGTLSDDDVMASFAAPRSIDLAVGVPGSVAECDFTSTSNVIIDILHMPFPYGVASTIGTVTFTSGNQVGVISFPAPITLAPDDLIQLFTPSSVDTNIADISVTLVGSASVMGIGGGQDAIQFQDEGINLGSSGTVDTVNFTGAGVTATRLLDVLTVNITGGGGGGPPGGADTNIQFNDAGVFGGESDFTWNKTTNILDLTGSAHFTGRVGIGNAIPSGSVTLEITGDFQINSEIRFKETGVGTEYVGFKAPAALASNIIWTLPAVDGTAGQVLQTNGSGVLSFVTVTPPASSITFTPASGTNFGTTVPSASISSTNVQTAIVELLEEKAQKTPYYAVLGDLPAAALVPGMLAVIDSEDRPYFSLNGIWNPIVTASSGINIPYDIAFYVRALQSNTIMASYANTRSVFLPAGVLGSSAIADIPSVGSVTLNIVRKVNPYTSGTTVGTVTFTAGNRVGVIVWGSAVTLAATDLLQLVSQVTIDTTITFIAITLVGCTVANSCATS